MDSMRSVITDVHPFFLPLISHFLFEARVSRRIIFARIRPEFAALERGPLMKILLALVAAISVAAVTVGKAPTVDTRLRGMDTPGGSLRVIVSQTPQGYGEAYI
jgi:drug/metabolite transporter (DMT)-like permease